MNIAFLFPFNSGGCGSPIKWLPLGPATLIGNIKEYFPDIKFVQLDMEEELRTAMKEHVLDEKLSAFVEWTNDNSAFNKLIQNQEKLNYFFTAADDYLQLAQYDHFFLAVHNRDKIGVLSHYALSEYLKRKYPEKKIVVGGIFGYGDDYSLKLMPKDHKVDTFVWGRGENSAKEILSHLQQGADPVKKYKQPVTDKEVLANIPDYSGFIGMNRFRYNGERLERYYNIKLPRARAATDILFIPYKFSLGCPWAKCAYCGMSGAGPGVHHKDIGDIVNDLRRLKTKYRTKYFIFYNSNFNFSLKFGKRLLSKIIEAKLDILWTDSFNLRDIDNELLDMLAEAGCFRMDVGITSLNPEIQRMYDNILRNEDLKNLKEIHDRNIWIQANIIINLPHQYSVTKDIEVFETVIDYIDAVTVNSYREYTTSRLDRNYRQYGLKRVDEAVSLGSAGTTPMPYLERSYRGSIDDRKKQYGRNYIEIRNYFQRKEKVINEIHLYLLGYLYEVCGFDKTRIRRHIPFYWHN